jgi:hypothetical protein
MPDRLVPFGVLLAFVGGCSAPPAPAAPAAAPVVVVSGAERFLPLLDATVFAYETESETTGERGMLVLEVRRPRPERAELVVAGRVRRLEIDATGIKHVTGGWMLKEPIQVGAEWRGDFGQVRVTAIDRTVTTPAGTFSDCLETIETASGPTFAKNTTTAYCPQIGITARRTEVESDEGSGVESIRLRSHGPRVDVVGPAAP